MYTVNGTGSGFGSVVDISDPINPLVVGSFPSSHNITISDDGIMYLSAPGIRILDLNANPNNPTLLWTGGVEGHDITVVGDRMYDFHGGINSLNRITNIYDISNRANPQLLGAIVDQTISYHHQGWPTADGNYLLITDELGTHPQPDFTVWDIRDLSNPEKVGEYADPNATIHNLIVIGDLAYTSYYAAGFRIFDISDPTNPTLIDEFDTSPTSSAETFNFGAWGVYPFLPSGNILVSDLQTGLSIFAVDDISTSVSGGLSDLPGDFVLHSNYPNPFNPETTISFELPKRERVAISIYNQLGQKIRTLLDSERNSGRHQIKWNGKNDKGLEVSSGIYFYKIKTGDYQQASRMLLLR